MKDYKITYQILNYEKYYKRLENIINNPNNKFKIVTHPPIGKSKCGFNINHFSIGTGPKHIVYMAGAHGNEIIGVDYITQLMENIALANGAYSEFDPNIFTLDFIPCQNPEGFFTTTYALNSKMKGMDEEEIEKFCKKYYLAYREDDINITTINQIIKSFCDKFKQEQNQDELLKFFWKISKNKQLSPNYLTVFLQKISNIDSKTIELFVKEKWYFKKYTRPYRDC